MARDQKSTLDVDTAAYSSQQKEVPERSSKVTLVYLTSKDRWEDWHGQGIHRMTHYIAYRGLCCTFPETAQRREDWVNRQDLLFCKITTLRCDNHVRSLTGGRAKIQYTNKFRNSVLIVVSVNINYTWSQPRHTLVTNHGKKL